MTELFKEILAENQFEDLPECVPRETEACGVAGKALVVIGGRRSGKTMFLRQIYDGLKQQGCRVGEYLIAINFFDERLSGLSGSDLTQLLEALAESYPQRNKQTTTHFFLDEI
jgi:hypothetical protein